MSSLPTWTGRWVPFRLPVEVRVACNSAILAAPSLPGPAKLTKLLYKTQGNLRKSLRFLSLFPAGNGLALETTRNSNAGGSQGSEQGRWLRIQIRAVSTGLGCPRRSPDTSNHKQSCSQRPASAGAVRDNPAFERNLRVLGLFAVSLLRATTVLSRSALPTAGAHGGQLLPTVSCHDSGSRRFNWRTK